MASVQRHELAPGLCAFLDIAILAKRAKCLHTPLVNPTRTIAHSRPLPFLILEVLLDTKQLFCLPLSSFGDGDTQILNSEFKTDGGIGWHDRNSYFFTDDGWLVPFDCYIAASIYEMSPPSKRMRYARRQPEELAAIRNLAAQDLSTFLPVWQRPILEPVFRPHRRFIARPYASSPNFGA